MFLSIGTVPGAEANQILSSISLTKDMTGSRTYLLTYSNCDPLTILNRDYQEDLNPPEIKKQTNRF